ncbi:MAG: SDR family NAD(P)-dependent oxidoreductase [Burkholderiales bacterium]|jgi:3-oxoacyl-[acyl-carrier protein] reductase
MMMLSGKTAVVTGANRGIGRSVVETFAAHGCNVLGCVRIISPETLSDFESLQIRHGVIIKPVQLDLADDDSIKTAGREIVGQAGSLDIIVNNAGIASGGLFQMTSVTDMRKLFEINLFSQLLLTQSLVRKMVRQKSGSIINIASTAALFADPGTLAYGSSKAALTRASESMATELGAFNIRVNTISPGVTRTEMFDQMAESARNSLINRSALKRAAEPQEVANAALFLASELSAFITGQTLRVDGGIV